MPIYEYFCKKCKTNIDLLSSVELRDKQKCEECGKTLTQIISGGAMFDLRGDGYYKGGKDAPKRNK